MFIELFLGLIFLWYIYDLLKYKGRAPGPFRFPIVGNIPQLMVTNPKFIHLAFLKFKENYGDIMLIKLGAKELTVLNTYTAAKDLLKREELNRRDCQPTILLRTMDGTPSGLAMTNGDLATASRKFVYAGLSENGYGDKLETESDLVFEAEELIKFIDNLLDKRKDGNLHVEGLFNISSFNSIFKIITGERRSLDDEDMKNFAITTKKYIESATFMGSLGMIFPFTNYFYNSLKGSKYYADLNLEWMDRLVTNLRAKGKITNPQNLLEKFVMEVDKNLESGGKIELFSENHMRTTILDLFQGGIETTASSIEWNLLYLIYYQEVQEKLHKEIDSVLDKDSKPSLAYKKKLPYLQATIWESLRMSPIFPFCIPRKNSEKIVYNGITISKDSAILTNAYAINRDKKYWDDPEVFKPERFIDKVTGEVMKRPPIMTFGSGKKGCLGELIAMDVLFILMTALLQNYKFSKVPNTPLPTLDPVIGFTITPQPYNLIFTKK